MKVSKITFALACDKDNTLAILGRLHTNSLLLDHPAVAEGVLGLKVVGLLQRKTSYMCRGDRQILPRNREIVEKMILNNFS